jgi:hypothetical protein
MAKQSPGLRKSRLLYMFYNILRKSGCAYFDTAPKQVIKQKERCRCDPNPIDNTHESTDIPDLRKRICPGVYRLYRP